MSSMRESVGSGIERETSESGGFSLSRRAALRGIAGAAVLGVVGIPAASGAAVASSSSPLAVSDGSTVVTQYVQGTGSNSSPLGTPVAVNQPAQTYTQGGMNGASWPEVANATSVWWGNVGDADKAVWFEKEFTLAGPAVHAELSITCDNDYQVWVNGQFVGEDWDDPDHPNNPGVARDPNDPYDLGNLDDPYTDGQGNWGTLETYDVTSVLQPGSNTIVALGRNWASGGPAYMIFQVNGEVRTTIDLDIDVKPGNGDEVDPINPGARGVIPVAVYSTPDFDATTLVVGSLRFGAAGVVDAGDGASAAHGGHVEDVDGDGLPDLMLHFPSQDAGFADGDTVAKLVGETAGGTEAVGTDAVRTVGGRGRGRGN